MKQLHISRLLLFVAVLVIGTQVLGAEEVTLRMWEHTPQFEDSVTAVIQEFMKRNPTIKIELEVKTSDQYYNLLSTAIQSGDAPDIFWANGTKDTLLQNLVKMGGPMDLTGKLDLSGYNKMATDILYIDGKLWQTPGSSIDTRAVYYNKDIFDQYNLKVPTTLAEFEQICETLQSQGVTPISFGGKLSWAVLFTFEPIISAVCPDWLDEAAAGKAALSDPRLLEAFKKFDEWAEKGYFGKFYAGVDEGAMLLNFSKGNAAMCITGSWNAETFSKNNPDLKLGAFQMPMVEGGRAMIVTYSTGYCASATTKYPDEVLKFLEFQVTPEAQQISITVQGGIPGMAGLKAKNELFQAIGTADRQVESFYNILGFWPKEGKNPRKIWEEDCTKWVSGSLTAEELVKELEDAIDYSQAK
ncbi:MAG: sugar ABC transporter substrate-binding protein [Candidatus Vecturithrix sp.]|jgi:raffinose/stachyose/melibiose transport system substrate-binding protein|nr:sugar ABC transporter substrate-binding protein [Candidatus Vecturithrix sp.]